MFDAKDRTTPLLDVVFESGRGVAQYHTSVLFQALNAEENYLRIDVDDLDEADVSMDLSTDANLKNLEKIGQNLLNSEVKRMNLDTFKYEPIEGSKRTYKDELIRFAQDLSEELKKRKANMMVHQTD
ncbi:unnamed protein product [Eruca vesicaria subsp. sativa]|uniref:Uncharacterized protein n=1 Tax=Eruca vesicaria subsp. sativa TaxID=29727 RepID=A0ABC8JKR2_ERUVS|nr:unnamed protein product [Eruca vesicaria subsp. sativa]